MPLGINMAKRLDGDSLAFLEKSVEQTGIQVVNSPIGNIMNLVAAELESTPQR